VARAIQDADLALVAAMIEPPPLDQARSSLAYWRRRRAALPLYRRSARREADEMIRRWRDRVAAAERRRYGTGPMAVVRRLLAGDLPWRAVAGGLVPFLLTLVPRRLLLLIAAAAVTWLLLGVVVLVALAQLLA
jgi:hypothetical protein